MSTPNYNKIILEIEDGIAWITLNNPDKYNALDTEMRRELKRCLEDLSKDNTIRVVVIKGAGDSFSAGADLKLFAEAGPEEITQFLEEYGTSIVLGKIIREMPKPVIAAVHGYCLGGGFELSMWCDMIIASDDAVFGQPEIKVGLIPGGGGTQLLTRLIGEKKAKEYIFTGWRISPQELERLGVVNRVVPKDKLLDTVREIAKRIISMSPVMVSAAKEAINKALETSLGDGILFEKKIFTALFSTEDQKEGAKAFLEKRKPVWKGR
jgi:enoyl-CoA hydratase/carnithine racemase